MRRKVSLEISLIGVISLVILVFLGILVYEKKYVGKIDDLIVLIEQAGRNEEAKQELIEYESIVTQKLQHLNSRSEISQSYFVLGYIERMKGDLSKSNDYFIKATRLGETKHPKLNVMIYRAITSNYLELGELENSQEYFQKTEAIAKEYQDDDLLASVYRSRSYGLVKYGNRYDEAIHLLQRALTLSKQPENLIESSLQLAGIYMNTFQEESAIDYSRRALELSITHRLDDYQQYSFISLGNAYYLANQYNESIHLFEYILTYMPNYPVTEYLVILMNAYMEVNGLEKAITELEKCRPLLIDTDFYGDSARADKWINTVKSSIYLQDEQIETALEYWMKGEDSYVNSKLDAFYQSWRKVLFLSIQLSLEPQQSDILSELNDLYQLLDGYIDYPSLKPLILKTMIDYSVGLGNYEVAYGYTQEMLKKFTFQHPQGLEIEEIHNWMNNEVNLSTFEQRNRMLLTGVIVLNTLVLIGYLMIKNKILKKKLEIQSLHDPVTLALTLPAFYQALELYDDSNQETHFIVIDIDYFEKYNQAYGRLAGEVLLQELLIYISNSYPSGIIGRFNGCQFMIASTLEKEEAIFKAKQLVQEIYDLNLPHVINLEEERVTISIGMSTGMSHSKLQIDRQIEAAQRCLKEAKQKGKNTFVI